MDSTQFKRAVEAVSDELINYIDTVHDRPVMSSVEPGYLKKLLPDLPPADGEKWETIQRDMESKIMPGMTHWNSPNFMAYFPAPTSYPSMLGELYSSALAVSAFNWECAPAVTELEIVVMDWVAKMLNLPSCFLSSSTGGGVMQGTTSEAILSIMVAARERYLHQTTAHLYGVEKEIAIAHRRLNMVALGSEASHSCTQKAAMILGIRYRSVPVFAEDDFAMTGDMLDFTLKQCKEDGLEPFYLTATLGTTATCAVDKFDQVAQVLRGHPIWVHVDAAYAGAALVCEEYQSLTEHFESFDSFSMSMSKWLLTNIDAVCCFIKDKNHLIDALSITPAYLRNDASDSGAVTDFRHWGVPLSRRFRALKIWFVMRTYGVNGFKSYIRNHIKLGCLFSSLIASRADLFRIVTPPAYALTVISIVPRVPALFRKFLAVKAKEMRLSRNAVGNGIYHGNGAAKPSAENLVNGVVDINEKSRIRNTHQTNGYTNGQTNGHINSHKTNGQTNGHINGHTNGQTNGHTNGQTNGDINSHKTNGQTNGHINGHINGHTNSHTTSQGNSHINSRNDGNTNGHTSCHTNGQINGAPKVNGILKDNGISNVNGNGSIDAEAHVKNASKRNSYPAVADADGTSSDIAISCLEDWLTEYANMVTKAVYELVKRQGEIMLTSTVIGGIYVIRVNSANPKTEEKYLRRAFEILVSAAEEVLDQA